MAISNIGTQPDKGINDDDPGIAFDVHDDDVMATPVVPWFIQKQELRQWR